MPKTLLLTGFDNNFKPIGNLTSPLLLSYASQHDIDFLCLRDYPKDIPASWYKVTGVLTGFAAGYDRVLWMDADILITNPTIMPPWTNGFHASCDWSPNDLLFNMGCFLACRDTRYLFEELIKHRSKYPGQPWEQACMRNLYRRNKETREIIHIHPRRMFNAVPIEVHGEVVDPWQPGDWVCHLTNLPIEQRIALFHKIRQRCA
jgi:hypothetical protein